jgi:hypothetical protein
MVPGAASITGRLVLSNPLDASVCPLYNADAFAGKAVGLVERGVVSFARKALTLQVWPNNVAV